MTTICPPTLMNSVTDLRDALEHLSQAGLLEAMLSETADLRRWLKFDSDFVALAHRHQEPPAAANNGGPWTTWLMLGGRGAGKTRAGAEWLRAQALGLIALCGRARAPPRARRRDLARRARGDDRGAVRPVAPRAARASGRNGMPSRRRLEWPNGAVALAFSAEDPEQLRGPQFDAAWCDELAKWPYPDAAFDMLQFGLRLGARPRQLVTTTPRPMALIKRLVADPRTAVTRASTHANAAHLSPAFLDEVIGRYAGTRLGRQEIDGDIIEERADALWTRATIEAARVPQRRRLRASSSASIRPVRRGPAPTPAALSRRAWPRTGAFTCWRTPACRAWRRRAGR